MSPVRVLTADDHETYRRLLAGLARVAFGAEVVVSLSHDGNDALARLKGEPIDILLTDPHMPGASGVEVARAARGVRRETRVLLVTRDATEDELREAARAGVFRCIRKPFDIGFVVAVLQQAARTRLRRRVFRTDRLRLCGASSQRSNPSITA